MKVTVKNAYFFYQGVSYLLVLFLSRAFFFESSNFQTLRWKCHSPTKLKGNYSILNKQRYSLNIMAPQPHTNFDAKGIISLDGKELHIFDSEGECRVFVFKYPSDLRMGDLCFNPHNIPGDMLTACLDPETGLHVDEDDVEPGPSGETLPHLHAHRRSHNPCCSKNVQKEMLANEGLLVLKDDGDDGVLDAPLNENFPEACNADLMDKNQPNHDEFHGTRIKIKHGDHFDELVVHPTEGKSTLLMRTEKDCESGNHR